MFGPIHFDEWPADDRLGFIVLHKTIHQSPEILFKDDPLADIIWSKYFPEHQVTVVILHHPLFQPVDKKGQFHQYDCRIRFLPRRQVQYEYRLVEGGHGSAKP